MQTRNIIVVKKIHLTLDTDMNVKVVLHTSYGMFSVSKLAMEYMASEHTDALRPESSLVESKGPVEPHRTGKYTRQLLDTGLYLHRDFNTDFVVKWPGTKDPEVLHLRNDLSLEVRSHEALVDAVEVLGGERAGPERGELKVFELELYLNAKTNDGYETDPSISSVRTFDS